MAVIIPIVSKFDDRGIKKSQSAFAGLANSLKSTLGAVGIATSIAGLTSSLSAATKAASDDAKSQIVLAQQLRNTTKASAEQIASVENVIAKFSLMAGVADDQLRPALASLVRATGDIGKAQGLLSLALDVSAATGKDLNAVSLALGKAYAGQTSQLFRMIPALKGSKDFMAKLREQTAGMAEAAGNADPFMQLNIIFDEMQESIGALLLPKLKEFVSYLKSNEGQNAIKSFVDGFSQAIDTLVGIANRIGDIVNIISAPFNRLKVLGYVVGKSLKLDFAEVNKVMAMGTNDAVAYIDKIAGTKTELLLSGNASQKYGKQQKELYEAMRSSIPTINTQITALTSDTKAKKANTDATKASKKAQEENSKARIAYWEKLKATREALQAEADALAEAQKAMRDATSGIKTLMDTSVNMGEFESRVVDTFTNIKDVISSSLADGKITRSAAYNLSALADTTQASIQAIAKQRDELVAKRSLVEALIGDVKGSLMGAGNITGLLETQSKTVTQTVTQIINGLQVAVSSTTEEITSGGLLKNFKSVLDKTKAFAGQLKELRKLGLDQNLFKQIVDAGAEAGGAVAAEIIAGGADAVNEINGVYKDLADVSGQIAEQTAVVMYNDGKDVAGGLVAGLLAQEQALKDAATTLANAFMNTFNSMISSLTLPSQADKGISGLNANGFAYSSNPLIGGTMESQFGSGTPWAQAVARNANPNTTVNVVVNAGVGTNGKVVGQAILEQINTYKAANGGSF